jgi:hypothetical protein
MKLINLESKTFGHWFVLKRAANDRSDRTCYVCRCTCGIERTVLANNLRKGTSTNCGCSKPLPSNTLRPYEALYNQFVHNVKRRQSISLKYEDFLVFTNTSACCYCGAEVFWTKFGITRRGAKYNLDRKDNNLGYSKENCVVCCWPCNVTKSSRFTHQQMLEIGNLIRGWMK